MKSHYLIAILLVLLTTIISTGCYTVLWTPDDRMPSESDYENTDDQYNTFGYGTEISLGYGYYYSYPWWYSINYSPTTSPNNSYNNSTDMESLRNSSSGRNIDNGRNQFVDTPPPSQNSNTNAGSNTNSNSGSTTQSENSDNRNKNTGSDNSVRNDNGSRNSEGKRK